MTDSTPQTTTPSYRGLLALVIILGVLFLVALIGVVAAIVLRSRGAGSSSPAAYAARVAAPGEHLEGAAMEGGRILLRFSGAPNGDELVVIEAATGRIVGRIAVETER